MTGLIIPAPRVGQPNPARGSGVSGAAKSGAELRAKKWFSGRHQGHNLDCYDPVVALMAKVAYLAIMARKVPAHCSQLLAIVFRLSTKCMSW